MFSFNIKFCLYFNTIFYNCEYLHFLPISTPILKQYAVDIINNIIKPIPNNMPVIKRLVLLLSYFVFACIKPSVTRGINKTKNTHIGKFFKKKYPIGVTIIPISSPVHLAHIGNCFPWKKNERSGLWWHPNMMGSHLHNHLFMPHF